MKIQLQTNLEPAKNILEFVYIDTLAIKSGSYKDEMPQEILDGFLYQAGETLTKLGYLHKG